MEKPLTDTQGWTLAQYEMGTLLDWSSLVFIRVMRGDAVIGYIFVIDRQFGEKAKYKLPGGHNKPGETPYDTALREVLGEAGITATDLKLVDKWVSGHGEKRHWKCLFVGDVTEHRSMNLNSQNEENEGEDPEFFTVVEFHALVREDKFLRNHYDELVYCGLIEPVPLPAMEAAK